MTDASVNKLTSMNGKNKDELFCTNTSCSSKILLSNVGTYAKCGLELPKMTCQKSATEVETDLITECFQVKDPFQFENVGFSKTVNNIKYLACSDCELGPVGWQELPVGICCVAISRVQLGLSQVESSEKNAN